jgi:hypothetical protein
MIRKEIRCGETRKFETVFLSAAPGGRALALAEVAFVVGDFLEGFGGLRLLLVKVAVEDCGENAG